MSSKAVTKAVKRLKTTLETRMILELKEALEESVKLQSHYASLLNAYDGGQRREFKDATITEAVTAEWQKIRDDKEDGSIVESMGSNLKTTKGYVTIESRVEHNGYYGGRVEVSEICPMDQYSSPREWEDSDMRPLEDF